MSNIQKDIVLNEEGDYQSIEFRKVDLSLIEWIEKKYRMDVRNGEILFIRGKLYWTSKGCSRISESKKTKGIRFEYIDPNKFSMPNISQNPSRYIIVKCLLEKEDGGIVEGTRILDLIKEKRLSFPKKCECGKEGKYAKKTDDPEIKKCQCGKELKGTEYWILKDYIAFAETKAFMRACKLAYSVSIEDDIPEDDRDQAIDIANVKRNQEVDVEFSQSPIDVKPESKIVNLKTSLIQIQQPTIEKPIQKTDLKLLNQPEPKPEIKTEIKTETKPGAKPITLTPIKPQPAKPIEIKPADLKPIEKQPIKDDLNKPKSMSETMPLKVIVPGVPKTENKTETKKPEIKSNKLPYEKTRKFQIGSMELPGYAFIAKDLDYQFQICINTCRQYLEEKIKDKKELDSKWQNLIKEFEKSIKGKEDINLRICFFEIFKEIFSAADQIKAFEIFENDFGNSLNKAIFFAYNNEGLSKEEFTSKLGNDLLLNVRI
jgi:hypothetical protein